MATAHAHGPLRASEIFHAYIFMYARTDTQHFQTRGPAQFLHARADRDLRHGNHTMGHTGAHGHTLAIPVQDDPKNIRKITPDRYFLCLL